MNSGVRKEGRSPGAGFAGSGAQMAFRHTVGRAIPWSGCVPAEPASVSVLPSSVVMSQRAFGGWPAGLSFLFLSAATASCAIVGVVHVCRRNYEQHRRWMLALMS